MQLYDDYNARPASWGAFGGRSPKLQLVPPQVRIVPRNKVTGQVPLECILGPMPPKYCLCLAKRE